MWPGTNIDGEQEGRADYKTRSSGKWMQNYKDCPYNHVLIINRPDEHTAFPKYICH